MFFLRHRKVNHKTSTSTEALYWTRLCIVYMTSLVVLVLPCVGGYHPLRQECSNMVGTVQQQDPGRGYGGAYDASCVSHDGNSGHRQLGQTDRQKLRQLTAGGEHAPRRWRGGIRGGGAGRRTWRGILTRLLQLTRRKNKEYLRVFIFTNDFFQVYPHTLIITVYFPLHLKISL